MTAFLNPDCNNGNSEFAGIYVCSRNVLKYIPQDGYCDLKEGLIPSLWRAGRNVSTAQLAKSSGVYSNIEGYLNAVFENMNKGTILDRQAYISPSARIFGPALIMQNVIIEDDAILIGPVIIEKEAVIESKCDSLPKRALAAGASS